VEILPVSVHSHYGQWGRLTTALLLKRIERFCGMGRENRKLPLTERLRRCREHILGVNEKRYRLEPPGEADFAARLDGVIEAAMESAARILGAGQGEGDLFTRLAWLRQLCWDRIFLPGQDSLEDFTLVEQGMADLQAGEAWYAGRHLELVEFAWYFRGPVPGEDSPVYIKVEYVQNLWDFLSRSIGGGYSNRVSILPRRVVFQTGSPINLTERLPDYYRDKKAAVHRALGDLKNAYLDCTREFHLQD
jgi:hypothetical protein